MKVTVAKKNSSFYARLVGLTEAALTRGARSRYTRKEKSRRRPILLDWLLALLWAVVWVFVINQYFVQAYKIPSGSMIPTLLIGDRLFVDKFTIGPELLPRLLKFSGVRKIVRGDIVVFESPDYLGKSAAFEIVHRLIYMITLSLVDIDRSPDGQPSVQLLIKRAVGDDGDRIRFRDGAMFIKPRGESHYASEADFEKSSEITYASRRLFTEEDFKENRILAEYAAYYGNRRGAPPSLAERAIPLIDQVNGDDSSGMNMALRQSSAEYWRLRADYLLNPYDKVKRQIFFRQEVGYYVPDGYVLPLGDNRDNSHDGRWFGVIAKKKILGRAFFRFFPLTRLGSVK